MSQRINEIKINGKLGNDVISYTAKIFVRYDENDKIFHMTDELHESDRDHTSEECDSCLKPHIKLKHWYFTND